MVPVPEEFVQDAMAMVLRLSKTESMQEWDQEAISRFFLELPERAKAVVSAVARASMDEEGSAKEDAIGRSIEHSVREVRDIVKSANAQATDDMFGPIITTKTLTETLPNGRTRDDRRLSMPTHLAEWVREAEREEARSIRNPLIEDD